MPGVLIVDDQAAVRTVLEAAFRSDGFRVWSAGSGEEALEVYRRHVPEIALVLVDVRMPGADGPQTVASLRRLDPEVVFCFMSGDLGTYSEEDLRKLGAAEVFFKPFSPAEVLRRCRQLTHTERRAAPRLPQHQSKVVVGGDQGDHSDWECWLKDCSRGGVALWGPHSLPVGMRLRVRSTAAPEPRPWAQVEVRHCRPEEGGWLMGCQFLGGEADARTLSCSGAL
jgi:CheY-like chemotaxis protein